MHYDELKRRLAQAERDERDGADVRDALRRAWSFSTNQHDLDAPQVYDTDAEREGKLQRVLDRIQAKAAGDQP